MLFEFNTTRGDFFIQLKGNNAGTPLKYQSPNSIGVIVNRDYLLPDYFYYMMMSIQLSGLYKPYLKGSVIPYIRHEDIVHALLDYFNAQGMLHYVTYYIPVKSLNELTNPIAI
jgi:hypothetical protein